MSGQHGFCDIEERYALLSKAGDPLEPRDEIVPWDVFRKPLAKALKRSDGARGTRPSYLPVMMFKILVLQALYDLSKDVCARWTVTYSKAKKMRGWLISQDVTLWSLPLVCLLYTSDAADD